VITLSDSEEDLDAEESFYIPPTVSQCDARPGDQEPERSTSWNSNDVSDACLTSSASIAEPSSQGIQEGVDNHCEESSDEQPLSFRRTKEVALRMIVSSDSEDDLVQPKPAARSPLPVQHPEEPTAPHSKIRSGHAVSKRARKLCLHISSDSEDGVQPKPAAWSPLPVQARKSRLQKAARNGVPAEVRPLHMLMPYSTSC
jgi:hypothetical protein